MQTQNNDLAGVIYLRNPHSVTLAPTKGTVTLAGAKDVFTVSIDPNFISWGTDQIGVDTGKETVDVHEMTKEGTHKQILGSLTTDPRQLCLSQGQIVEFCCAHREHLPTEGGSDTRFLFEGKNQELFVAHVYVCSDRLKTLVSRFDSDHVWHVSYWYRHLFVVKQLTA